MNREGRGSCGGPMTASKFQPTKSIHHQRFFCTYPEDRHHVNAQQAQRDSKEPCLHGR